MKKIFYLSTCSTNKRILDELHPGSEVEMQDIKVKNIDSEMLDMIKEKVGSYEALFSKRALKYKSLGLDKQSLQEDDYRKYMLEEYTFIKRPFIICGDEVFVGPAKDTILNAGNALRK